MSWQSGRQLASMTKGSDTLSFAYNESGLRTSKTVNGVTHSYVWQGSKLAADNTDAYALYFHYNSSGDVIGFTRTANGTDTEYFYVKNLQGDILKVITVTGTEAATYTYDAWGKLLTSTGDLADVNPLRYRGYFYDTETSLYYLKSRYYDPEVCRFISADAYASTGQGILGTNMFSYCRNNSVISIDVNGHRPLIATILSDSGTLIDYTILPSYKYFAGYYNQTSDHEIYGLFGGITPPSIKNGINIVDSKAGIVEVSGDLNAFSWRLSCVTANAHIGVSQEYIGAEANASLVNGEFCLKFPISARKTLYIGLEGFFLGVGVNLSYNRDINKFKIGLSNIFGGSIVVALKEEY